MQLEPETSAVLNTKLSVKQPIQHGAKGAVMCWEIEQMSSEEVGVRKPLFLNPSRNCALQIQ